MHGIRAQIEELKILNDKKNQLLEELDRSVLMEQEFPGCFDRGQIKTTLDGKLNPVVTMRCGSSSSTLSLSSDPRMAR